MKLTLSYDKETKLFEAFFFKVNSKKEVIAMHKMHGIDIPKFAEEVEIYKGSLPNSESRPRKERQPKPTPTDDNEAAF